MCCCWTCAFCDQCSAWLKSHEDAVLICPKEAEAEERKNSKEDQNFSEFVHDLIMDFFRKGEVKDG